MLEELQEVKRVQKDWVLPLEELSRKIELVSRLERVNLLEEISLGGKNQEHYYG